MKPHTELATVIGVWLLPILCVAQSLPNDIFRIDQFEIGKSTLDDVRSRFGPSNQFALEEGDGADVAVCYCNRNAASAPAIVFETGALGGWTVITAYRLTKRGKMRCTVTEVPLLTLSTANGLSLNSDARIVASALGRPMANSGVRVEEVYQRPPLDWEAALMRRSNVDPSQVTFDVADTVEVKMKLGRVEQIYVKRLVSF